MLEDGIVQIVIIKDKHGFFKIVGCTEKETVLSEGQLCRSEVEISTIELLDDLRAPKQF